MSEQISQAEGQSLLAEFLSHRTHDGRYASFDYCFGYFQDFRKQNNIAGVYDSNNIRRSCLELGFYLASWGMLRGSSDLLNKSFAFLRPVIQTISTTQLAVWKLDVDQYDSSTWSLFKAEKNRIITSLGNLRNSGSEILATKIMLGVYGNVPAFDQFFKSGLGVSLFGPVALHRISGFYTSNRDWLDPIKVPVLDFNRSNSQHFYTKAKLIDMIFFTKGLNQSKQSYARRGA